MAYFSFHTALIFFKAEQSFIGLCPQEICSSYYFPAILAHSRCHLCYNVMTEKQTKSLQVAVVKQWLQLESLISGVV